MDRPNPLPHQEEKHNVAPTKQIRGVGGSHRALRLTDHLSSEITLLPFSQEAQRCGGSVH